MPATHKVAIIGAGFGGLGMGMRLREAGENSFVILEKEARLGGTWRDNAYPGAACDVPSHLYSFTDEPNPDWSHVFAPQAEILSYMERLAERRGLLPHLRCNAEVTGAAWDDEAQLWRVSVAGGETVTARILIPAWGQLNRPSYPRIEGLESFAGPAFHSARWREDVALAGRRVGCIGSAASAVQLVPPVAEEAAHLTVFQRSPNWIAPRMNRAYAEEELAAWRADPALLRASREAMFTERDDRFAKVQLGTHLAEEVRAVALAHLEAQVPDPALRAKLTPDYPVGCRRILVSDDYYPALMRPDVELVTERIARIVPEGVVTADGALHRCDVLVHATGFETHSFLGANDITGRGGQSLRARWEKGAEAYLGMTVPGFPNMFFLYGPNTNLGHNSILMMLEAQFRYILQAMEILEAEGAAALDLRPAALTRFSTELQRALEGAAWSGGCTSWYKTAEGRIVNNWSGTVAAYQDRTARLAREDYETLVPQRQAVAAAPA
ncbi:cyclohexanone monooxygenase [Pseudoroseomonas rhizosphaerae]|uniref:Cyclohexanone monooxygenase n=1 Tax=Teichococcus rhizosphaerae TaxID=1335062 RepID=A0A2C7AAT8_9PROT|nr:NAD(P)/FAD-dependent oxidoreductase [Pseudoroseomonas rhizosphaerae]PHK95520.1 cyclohexanone monooxygenase [Pseudoroseomonas rhizosphaerae]